MSLVTPTTKELSDQIIAQLESSLNQTIPLLPKAFNRVLSKSLSFVFILLYKYGGFIFLQIFVDTATIQDTEILGQTVSPLKLWGRLIGIGDPAAATSAELTIDITVTNQSGNLEAGTQLLNSDNGVTYIILATVVLDAPTVSASIKAVADQAGGNGSGSIGNLENGAIVSFANPLANVNQDAVVTATDVQGADGETTEAYRQRIKDKFRKRPQGGAYADYQEWATSVVGIINAYPYTSPNPGQVDVYSEATEESSGSPDGIPTGAQLQAVLDAVELDEDGLATRRPATAYVNSYPITRRGFDVTVFGLVVDNPSQIQDDIETALNEYFFAREPYIPGVSVPPRNDRITQSGVGGVVEDIVSANEGIFDSVALSSDAIPVGTYTLVEGEKAKLSSLVFDT